MKTFKTLIVLCLLNLFALHCNDREYRDNKEVDFEFNSDFLKETNWEGTIVWKSYDTWTSKISILFTTADRGNAVITYTNSNSSLDFTYQASGKLLTAKSIPVSSGFDDIEGDWMVIEKSKDHLILKRGINNEGSNTTLNIRRSY